MSDTETNNDQSNQYDAMANHEFDEAINNMQENIQKEIAIGCPLVSDKYDVMALQYDYDDEVYLKKIQQISTMFGHVRKTRGDGNCFFRSFGFSYMEYLIENPEQFTGFKKKLEDTKSVLEKLGYPTFTVEDFYDQFMDVVNDVEKSLSIEMLKETYCNEGISNYLVVFLRLITSSYLQINSDFYQNFIEDGRSMHDFCKGEVEPMDRESDHIHIIAISTALNVSISVAYVDRGDEMTYHNFPEESNPQIHLLYRPGHYDILYPK